jgi:hypothetical protein
MSKILNLMTLLNFRHESTLDGGKGYNGDGVIRTYKRIDEDFRYHVRVIFDEDNDIINAYLTYSINTNNDTSAYEVIDYDDVIFFLNSRFKFELRKSKLTKLLNE